jgi:hypothetical protein
MAEPPLVYTLHNLLAAGRLLDALGAFYLTGPCTCGDYSRGINGYSVVTPEPGLQLDMCGTCGRPTNKDRLLPETPYQAGDVAFWCELLWTIVHAPGPTGAVVLQPLDADETVTVHLLQLNREA